ncbi:MAG: sulfatase-like hydrolase/transferase, partial [Dehalococcoidia bacterium]
YGASFIKTPSMDSIAAAGVRYDRAYSASPVCVPARTSLMTGMNAIRNGVTGNLHAIRGDYREAGIRTWPELLAGDGYYTAAVGKMHFYPWDARLGFQYRVAAEDKRWLHVRDDYFQFLREAGLRKLHGNEHEGYFENKGAIVNRIPWEYSVDHFVGQEACRFIEQYGSDGPFAMMVGFPGPHCPYDPAPDFPGALDFKPEDMPPAVPDAGDTPLLRQANVDGNRRPWNGVDHSEFTDAHKLKIRAHYAGSVLQIDYEVGQILEALRSNGLLDNTVVILATDHGDYLGDHGLIGKASFFESAMHIPLLAQGPGVAAGASSNELVELTDVTATMLRVAGLSVPEHMDSQPLPGLGLPEGAPRDRVVGMLADGWMLFDGEWKLSKYATGETVLFNLREDPDEQRNRVGDASAAEVYARLDAELSATVMEAMRRSMHDRLAHTGDLSQDPAFGRDGWLRPYPHSVAGV